MLWVILLLLPLSAVAAPAEMPPDDYAARQYIDSRGCVFLRDDDGRWQARLARDGTEICGYPPTQTIRGLEGRPRLSVLDPNAGKTHSQLIEEALTRTVVTQLQPGELSSDPRPLEKLPDMGPEPASEAPLEALRATVKAASAVRQGMGRDLKPNQRLCELLGYDGSPVPATTIGSDPTKGYCGTLPDMDLSRLSFARPAANRSVEDPGPPAAKAETATVGPARRTAAPPAAAAPAAPVARAQTPKPKSAPAPVVPSVGMIPPGARYVQIGTYANAGNADRAAERARRLGYPVLRGRDRARGAEVQIIMAGPFDSREAIVRALDGLRRGGFRDAYPR
ncbi:SPOR domain-containing protein [Paracoccus shanxieyensis]|uniref:SPOR domain-containing protein n=1 Tax=Paracoccus shanxieyensis TaxID=2675752 RepID=UPI0031342761